MSNNQIAAPRGDTSGLLLLLGLILTLGFLLGFLLVSPLAAALPGQSVQDRPEPSAMGALFMGRAPLPSWLESIERPTPPPPGWAVPYRMSSKGAAAADIDVTPGVPRFQSETTIAAAGQLIVVGYNDASGFFNPGGISVSGFSYSSDGGQTFTYGGQLPLLGDGDAVRGDPDVKVFIDPISQLPVFVYSSLYRTAAGGLSLCVHVSTDGGMTWNGPREVSTVTSPTVFPDKVFMDVDPETGRLLLSWTSFGSTLEMRTTYSDDLGLTWAAPTVFSARFSDGQGTCPRFDPTSDNAYIVWRSYGSPDAISFVRSTDNGVTWSQPEDIILGVSTPLPPYGSDRINGFPSLAVSPQDGDLHLVYASGSLDAFGDIYYARSSDAGLNWSAPVILSGDPGNDRAQFFSWISATAGPPERLDVIWYDQRSGTGTSDLTEAVHVHSLDGGGSWSAPVALHLSPFHAEYGQDTGQPNIGDYNQCFSQQDLLLASYARTEEPDYQTTAPNTYVAVNDGTSAAAGLYLQDLSVNDLGCTSDGHLVAGEIGDVTFLLRSQEDVPLSSVSATVAILDPAPPLVQIVSGSPVSFGSVAALGTTTNATPLRLRLADDYPCGQPIVLRLQGTSSAGAWVAQSQLETGTGVGTTVLLAESFDATGAGLPPGWTYLQVRGTSNPWEVSSAYAASAPRSLFCADVPDTNLSRVVSPSFVVPVDADLIEVDFKVTYDMEEVGNGRQGYDGALLKLNIDGADRLAGAFSSLFEDFYPYQLVRGSGPSANPLQDLAVWSGNTLPEFASVHIQYPGLAGRTVKLAFEVGCDIAVGGTGIFVDDVEVRSIPLGCGSCTAVPVLAVSPQVVAFPPIPGGATSCQTVQLQNEGEGFLHITSISGCESGPFSLDLSSTSFEVFPLDSTSFDVCVLPQVAGPDTCMVTIESDGGTAQVLVTYDVVTGIAASGVPANLTVAALAPNPFNPRVTIQYSLPRTAPVDAAVYDLSGHRIRRLLAGDVLAAGPHSLVWDGEDGTGRPAASGVYMIRISSGKEVRTVRGTLVR
jgi:hypothetical protein